MAITNLNDENFEDEVLKNDKPVLVDFWATWCPPCKMIAPFIEKLADEYGDKMKICKLNVDDGRQVSANYAVEAIPTLFIFNQGKVVDKIVGLLPYEALAEKVKENI